MFGAKKVSRKKMGDFQESRISQKLLMFEIENTTS